MRNVVIVGAGLTKFGEQWKKSFREMITEAAVSAILDSKLEGKDIEAIYTGTMATGKFIGQEHIGALISDRLGLNPIPSTRLEAACASGSVALKQGYLSIKSGEHDIVAVGGVEKMTEVGVHHASSALGGAGDQETELFHGATFPALYALLARAHMKKFGTTEKHLAQVAVKNHENGVDNPFAQFRNRITIEHVLNSSNVSSPLKLLDCSPLTDGAAGLILMEKQKALDLGLDAVEIVSMAQASDSLALTGRKSLTELNATKQAGKLAYKKAGITAKDIDIAEVHDCFTIAEILAIEDLDFVKKGSGGNATMSGFTAKNGSLPINTSGGLKAKGHPVGATGVAQAVEISQQLLGKADKRQVKGLEYGLTHNVGGSGATCVVGIYRRA